MIYINLGKENLMNSVLNFSYHTAVLPSSLEGLNFAEISSKTPAYDAAVLSEKKNYDFLIVKENKNQVGLFFPAYLKEFLHAKGKEIFQTHSFRLDAVPGQSETLPVMIKKMDSKNVDFHSEHVNIIPSFRKCPEGGGHIIYGTHCSIHNIDVQ